MFTLRFILRNLMRNKLRNALTVLGVIVTLMAFGMLRTVVSAWYAGAAAASPNRLIARNSVSIIFPLPLSYKERIGQVSGVNAVHSGNWFGGVYIDEKNFFANFAVDPGYVDQYPEYAISDEHRAAFRRDRQGALAGQKLMDRFGWKVGDQITLKGTIYPGDWPMVIRGSYKVTRPNADETILFFQWDYFNESLKKLRPSDADQPGFYLLTIDDPSRAGEISRQVDQMFVNSQAETLTETEEAFVTGFIKMSEAIIAAIQAVSYVVIVIILAVAANTMAMTARERTAEYAAIKTLGFGPGYLARLIMGESLALSLIGAAASVAAIFPVAAVFRNSLQEFFPVFDVDPMTIGLQLGFGLLVGVISALWPIALATRIRPAEGLRKLG